MADYTEDQLKELHEMRKALSSEFLANEANPSRTQAKTDIEELKPEMLEALSRALKHGTIEQSSKVAMWGYGKLLEEGKAGNDPLRTLLEGMPTPTQQSTPVNPMPEPTAEAEAKAQTIPDNIIDA